MSNSIGIPDRFSRWTHAATELGFTDFVSSEDGFRTDLKRNCAWANHGACGIYFWIAQDGETYVGQTVNARSRLREHWRNHPDLSYACFKQVPESNLDEVEVALIRKIGAEFRTRNIKHALETKTHVPFDEFVPGRERAAFLRGDGGLPDLHWRELPLLEQKQSKSFARLLQLPDADAVLEALTLYIGRALPRPATTEARFWSVSLFVQDHTLRVNAGQQEVFTITRAPEGRLYARPLSLQRFAPDAEGPMYQTGSYDAWIPLGDLNEWLQDERILACRQLVVRLMRHTTTLNSGNHCPQAVRTANAQTVLAMT